jgi:hypothetical protein
MPTITPVPGTWAWEDIPFRAAKTEVQWWIAHSALMRMFASHGVYVALPQGRQYRWSTDLGGLGGWFSRLFHGRKGRLQDHRDWQTGGDALLTFLTLAQLAHEDMNVLCHSHGWQVVAYACAYGLRLHNVVAVAPPIRQDMMGAYRLTAERTCNLLHVIDSDKDATAEHGALGDGSFIRTRRLRLPNVQIAEVEGISHSRILHDRQELWVPPSGYLTWFSLPCPAPNNPL